MPPLQLLLISNGLFYNDLTSHEPTPYAPGGVFPPPTERIERALICHSENYIDRLPVKENTATA